MTGGEDGTVCWWNIVDSQAEWQWVDTNDEPKFSQVELHTGQYLKTIHTLRPEHQIHLSESAQFYGVVLVPETCCFVQNDCILSFYTVKYVQPD